MTRRDGVRLYKSYSDANKYIRKVGTEEVYAEAVDVENAGFEYEETDQDLPESEQKVFEEPMKESELELEPEPMKESESAE